MECPLRTSLISPPSEFLKKIFYNFFHEELKTTVFGIPIYEIQAFILLVSLLEYP